jgi:hypothetical protein
MCERFELLESFACLPSVAPVALQKLRIVFISPITASFSINFFLHPSLFEKAFKRLFIFKTKPKEEIQ